MEQNTKFPALSGQDIDPDTFRRVWERVMPDQAQSPVAVTTPDSGATVPDSAVPGQPSTAPDTGTGTETEPDLPPVPTCTSAPGQGDAGSSPSPSTPSLCLGEDAQPYTGQLETLMTMAQAGGAAGRALARRASGMCAKCLTALAADHCRAFRQLSAAYFLITGQRFRPARSAPELPASLPLALRSQFVWEQRWEQANRQAAQGTDDTCLKALYEELAQEGALHAGTIRSLLEQM